LQTLFRKIIKSIAVLAIFVVILLLLLLLLFYTNRKSDLRTLSTAFDYLSENYDQEMVLEHFFKNIVEQFIVLTFSKKDNPNFTFTLYMGMDRDTSRYRVIRDNYFEALILYGLEEKYAVIANRIWECDVVLSVFIDRFVVSEFSYLDEFSTIHDVENNSLNELFRLSIDKLYPIRYADKEVEAEKILGFINYINKEEYLPSLIMFNRFLVLDGPVDRAFHNRETFTINDVRSITSIKQIIDFMESGWFNVIP